MDQQKLLAEDSLIDFLENELTVVARVVSAHLAEPLVFI